MMKHAWFLLIVIALVSGEQGFAAAKPVFQTKVVTSQTPGHAVDVKVPLNNSKDLYLVVTDGGNGYGCDWADWAEPRLTGSKGELKLTELKWQNARADWGQVRNGRNAGGGPLKIKGKSVEFGIGTHANSVIHYKLPAGYDTFTARAGLDNGGTDQSGGGATSVQFYVFLEKPPAAFLQSKASGAAPDLGSRDPADALKGLEVADGLEATLFAAEPMMLSPTNIDIDHKGRVWVCEVVNYRHRNNSRPEGDRILILEDTDQDGQADKSTVFYQGRDIDSALGICVLDNKVIVSVAPNVFVFTDENRDGKADKKEVLFSNVGQPQHDHSAHAFLFGPDGKMYWNFGNTGRQVHDKNGKIITDINGNLVNDRGNPYREGMPFRCNLNGSEFEVLGWNFRNNYEVTVDSFGALWQSDNDDDGNRGVRINFVMEYGNYGYKDEITGAGWRSPRVNLESEIPLRHWHLNDPGVVPNLLQTGAGSPTGICIYEGDLLPKVFRNQIIHCDAGPNVVRSYPVKTDGAGYTAETENILTGVRDQWFRPSDVCVAPDGSLIIADWYDPGVGGHRMGDIQKGRLFRVAPPGKKYVIPKYDFDSIEGAIEALKSPNLETRYLAWTALHKRGSEAEAALVTMSKSDNPRFQARALWLLGLIEGRGDKTVRQALGESDPDLRMMGLRLARRLKLDVIPYIKMVVNDKSAAVRRECAIALRDNKSPEMVNLWVKLATQHDGKDRWYLEALGIAAYNRWDECLITWATSVGPEISAMHRDIIWRSRSKLTPMLLAELIHDPETPDSEIPRLLRSLDFTSGPNKQSVMIQLAFSTPNVDSPRGKQITQYALSNLKGFNVNNPQHKAAIEKVLTQTKGSSEYIALVARFNLKKHYPELLKLAQEKPQEQLGSDAIRTLLDKGQLELIKQGLNDSDVEVASHTAQALGTSADLKALNLLRPLLTEKTVSISLRQEAVRSMSKIRKGADELSELAADGKVATELKPAVAAALHSSSYEDIRKKADELFPRPATKDNKPLPPLSELVGMKGDTLKGKVLFTTLGTCNKCHVVMGSGKEVGPNLSEIGKKLSRQAMFQSIIYPSAGISHNYETYSLLLDTGNQVDGLLVSRTDEKISIKDKDGIVRSFDTDEIDLIKKQNISLMPADLQKALSAQDMVDIVTYMQTLTKPDPSLKLIPKRD